MLTLTPSTAAAVALHANNGVWIMFLQSTAPFDAYGPIKVEAVRGTQLASRLTELNNNNAYELRLIGLMRPQNAEDEVNKIVTAFAAYRLHDMWFAPNAGLLAFIAEHAQDAITLLLAQARQGAMSTKPVGIDEMADVLGVSVPTVRRMVKAGQIPFLRFGRIYRFVPADVVATLERRGR